MKDARSGSNVNQNRHADKRGSTLISTWTKDDSTHSNQT